MRVTEVREKKDKLCKSHPAIRNNHFANGYLISVGMKYGRLCTTIRASRDLSRALCLNGNATQWRICGVWRKIDFKEVSFLGTH